MKDFFVYVLNVGFLKQKKTSTKMPSSSLNAPSNSCAKCEKAIQGDIVIALGQSWHVSCLSCNQCNKIIEGDFYEHQGGAFCKTCMASKVICQKCQQPITKDYLIGDGKIFHPSCVDLSTVKKRQK